MLQDETQISPPVELLATDRVSVAEALAFGKARLCEAESASFTGGEALREARILLSAVTGEATSALLAFDEKLLSETELRLYNTGINERAAGKPMAFIRGSQEFYGLRFACGDSLIPRPDSETLVELAMREMPAESSEAKLKILDLGCGTGCLGIAFAVHCRKPVHLTLADADEGALQCASTNAKRHMAAADFAICRSDWCADINGEFDVVLCNPPYITTDDCIYLPRGVRCYEPLRALWGGDGGVLAYEILAGELASHLAKSACLCFEVGIGQADAVVEIFTSAGFRLVADGYDLGGIRRALAFRA